MSSQQDQARLLAERIARRMSQGSSNSAAAQTSRADNSRAGERADVGQELSVMRASLEELQQRLARIESHVAPDEGDTYGQAREAQENASSATTPTSRSMPAQATTRSPWLSGIYVPAAHPSQERFGIEEAAVSELVDFFEGEKKCELEPGGKPCDHCAMCSTRGF